MLQQTDSLYDDFFVSSQPIKNSQLNNDLKGLRQLSQDGIEGVVDVVEAMHQRIISLGGLLNRGDLNQTTGITAWVYKTIRKTTALSFKGLDLAAATFSPLLPATTLGRQRNQWVAILNGLLGDHLAATNNPLAQAMTWHHNGQNISPHQAAKLCNQQAGQPLLLIHGLCMNDEMWLRDGHNHGVALQQSHAMIPIYVRYNSGLAVYENGLLLERMLTAFARQLNAEKKCAVLCHSMGGLVFRSALHSGDKKHASWLKSMDKAVFLGTPHQGAVLEKSGNIIDYLISINPYSAPFTQVVKVRSHGIKNLRHGTVTPDHQTIQLPADIDAFALAASTHKDGHSLHHKWIGDGLVSVDSALGGHKHPDREVVFKTENKHTFNNLSHMGLLSDDRVLQHLQTIYSSRDSAQ